MEPNTLEGSEGQKLEILTLLPGNLPKNFCSWALGKSFSFLVLSLCLKVDKPNA